MDSYKTSSALETGEKVSVIGESSVGKTSIIKMYVNQEFDKTQQPTIGFEQYSHTETIEGESVKLTIWDTAGQERFRSLSTIFYKQTKCVVFVFDYTSKASFDAFNKFHKEIVENVEDKTPVVIVGNKFDLTDKFQVKEEEARSLAIKLGYFFISTSAKNNSNINELFRHIAELIRNQLKSKDLQEQLKDSQKQQSLQREPLEPKKGCCLKG